MFPNLVKPPEHRREIVKKKRKEEKMVRYPLRESIEHAYGRKKDKRYSHWLEPAS